MSSIYGARRLHKIDRKGSSLKWTVQNTESRRSAKVDDPEIKKKDGPKGKDWTKLDGKLPIRINETGSTAFLVLFQGA